MVYSKGSKKASRIFNRNAQNCWQFAPKKTANKYGLGLQLRGVQKASSYMTTWVI
jgi:hypothetical protein